MSDFKWPDFLCSNSKYVYLYRNNSFKEIVSYNGNLLYNFYGITWNNDKVYMSDGDYIRCVEEDFSYTNLPYKGKGIHQICCYDDNILIPNGGYNCIDCFNFFENKGKRYFWIRGKAYDAEHINSIFKFNDKYYVCHHNHKNPSFISKFDSSFYLEERYGKVGFQCHNVYANEKFVLTLSSQDSKIMIYDFEKNQIGYVQTDFYNLCKKETKKFLRGFAKTKDNFFVGVMESKEDRMDRNICSSWILAFDNKFNVVGCLDVPTESQFKEIRIVSEKDYAHNEFEFPYKSWLK